MSPSMKMNRPIHGSQGCCVARPTPPTTIPSPASCAWQSYSQPLFCVYPTKQLSEGINYSSLLESRSQHVSSSWQVFRQTHGQEDVKGASGVAGREQVAGCT